MAARRFAVMDERNRRRRRVCLALGAGAVVVVAVIGVAFSPLLDVDRLEVAAGEHTTPAAVKAATGVVRGDALATVDLDAVTSGVEALPWVDSVTVSREWPGTLQLTVTERQAALAFPTEGGPWALVDLEGRVLDTVPEPPAQVVVVEGTAVDTPPGQALQGHGLGAVELVDHLPASLRPRVVLVRADEATAGLEAVLLLGDQTVAVRFGPATQLPAKLLALATVIENLDAGVVPAPGLAVIDVRVPSSPALTRSSP